MAPRLKAVLLLALSLLRTALRLVFGRRRDGLSEFRAHYAADGLAPITEEERAAMARFGGCIACGLCDRGEGERMARSNGAYPGVMALVLSGSRSMPDFAAAARVLEHVPDAALEVKEGICPTAVPIREIARFVRAKAKHARLSLPSAAARV